MQKYSSHNYGSAIIFSYTVSTERPIYVQIQAGGWAETTLITNTDLISRFRPIRINGTNGDTFSSILKNKCNESVNFVAFTNNPSDNPFSFTGGYALVFHSESINSNNVFKLIGISYDSQPKIEVKSLDLRS